MQCETRVGAVVEDGALKVEVSPWAGVVGILLAGLFARLIIVLVSDGSNDIRTWEHFASTVLDEGIASAYQKHPACNHPPLTLWLAGALLHVSTATGIRFSILFKIPSLAAEVLTMLLLLRMSTIFLPSRYARWTLGAYALSPLPMLVSAFHGNTDALCSSGALLALYFMYRKQAACSGLCLATAMNVKLIPSLLAPFLGLSCARSSGPGMRALMVYSGAIGIGLSPLLMMHFHTPDFFARVVQYPVTPDRWGIMYFLSELQRFEIGQVCLGDLQSAYRLYGRYVVLCIAGVVGLLAPFVARNRLRHLAAMIACIFCVAAPGWGIQYLLYPLPFLLLSSPRLGLGYAVSGGMFAVFLYGSFLVPTFPFSTFHNQKLSGAMGVFGALVWAYLLLCLVRIGYECCRGEDPNLKEGAQPRRRPRNAA